MRANSSQPIVFGVCVLLAATACGTVSAAPSPKASTTAVGLQWISTPGHDPASPPTLSPEPGTFAACLLGNLKVARIREGVFGGGQSGTTYSARNVGPATCHVGGYLPVFAGGKPIPHGDNVVGVSDGNVRPSETATFSIVDSYGWAQNVPNPPSCPPLPQPVAITLGGTVFDHDLVRQDACNKTYLTPVGIYPGGVAPTPPPAISSLTATMDAPKTAKVGEVLRFTVTLHNPTSQPIDLSPCPSYSITVGPMNKLYLLNCSVASIPASGSQSYQMQVDVPATAHMGPQKFGWSLDLGADNAAAGVGSQITLVN